MEKSGRSSTQITGHVTGGRQLTLSVAPSPQPPGKVLSLTLASAGGALRRSIYGAHVLNAGTREYIKAGAPAVGLAARERGRAEERAARLSPTGNAGA